MLPEQPKSKSGVGPEYEGSPALLFFIVPPERLMLTKKMSVKDMLAQIQEWHAEATNFRNDGYVQHGYKEKLDALHARITAIMDTIELTGTMDRTLEDTAKAGKTDVYRASIRDEENND